MSSSHSQVRPARVIAEFGEPDRPLFLVEERDSEKSTLFIFRDADQALSNRTLAEVELEHVDPDAGCAELHYRTEPVDETNYTLSPGDIRGGLRKILSEVGVERATITAADLSSEQLERVGCRAVYDEVEFSLPVAA